MSVNIIPAYGYDYTSKAKVWQALESGVDFKVADASSQWNGKLASLAGLRREGVRSVQVRYGKLMKVTTFDI